MLKAVAKVMNAVTDSMAACSDDSASNCAGPCDGSTFMMTYCRATCNLCPDTGKENPPH